MQITSAFVILFTYSYHLGYLFLFYYNTLDRRFDNKKLKKYTTNLKRFSILDIFLFILRIFFFYSNNNILQISLLLGIYTFFQIYPSISIISRHYTRSNRLEKTVSRFWDRNGGFFILSPLTMASLSLLISLSLSSPFLPNLALSGTLPFQIYMCVIIWVSD